jgi:hypothetical protein
MTSQVFKFPGFFSTEVDLSAEVQEPVGIPAGIIGASERGPAFVPVTVGSFPDFKTRFGNLNPRFAAPYAVIEHLNSRSALTFVRVLGAGGNTTADDIETTRTQGTVVNAGFKVSASLASEPIHGAVQFLVARHEISVSESFGQAGFSHNTSLSGSDARLVRGVIFTANDTRIQVLDHDESWAIGADDAATANSTTKKFKIVISCSLGASFAADEGNPGIRIVTASLDPSNDDYFAKVLNTDPEQFSTYKHVVYANFAVDDAVASVGTSSGDVVIASGSAQTSDLSGDTGLPFLNAFGRFDTRYKQAKTPSIISQPFGITEHNLFHFEARDDGAFPNKKFKISISDIKKSSNPRYKFGTFTVLVRDFEDTDTNISILEQFNNVNLDPESENYICHKIGDRKAFYNFDAEDEQDRRLIVSGRYANISKVVRVVASDEVERKLIPAESLPFGFRGYEVLSTNSRLLDRSGSLADFADIKRLHANLGTSGADAELLAAVVPPIPFRFKITRGAVSTEAGKLEGAPGNFEIVDGRFFWGVKLERIKDVLNPNPVTEPNALIAAYTQFNGISELDAVVTSSMNQDRFHNHKFTLAKVAFGNTSLNDLTSSAEAHIKEAAYIRNGIPDVTNYMITDADDATNRITFATLVNKGATAATFNAFSQFAKFTLVLQGGFDGANILDKHAATYDDRASSTEDRTDGTLGNVNGSFISPGFDFNQNGVGIANNTVASYRESAKIITDAMASNVNVVAVPGQRDPLVTDFYADKVRDYGLALYVMDVPNYNAAGERVFDGETGIFPDPQKTANALEGRAIDNEFVASYFPEIVMDDEANGRRVTAPASVAAVSALAFNDRVAYPWFAPAGFNRAALDFVKRTTTRITQPERNRLFSAHINPIVKFPREGYVIFSQNTLEQQESALGSVNVVRMLNDLKRQVIDIGNRLIWENITPDLRDQLKNQINSVMTSVQIRQGIQTFKIICDSSNNSDADINAHKINCRIVLKPVRSVEFIDMNFVITRSGTSFV